MALKPTTTPPVTDPIETIETEATAVGVTEARETGFHVMHGGLSLGCYPTVADAEAFADGHPRANGLTVTVEEVSA